MGQKNIRLCTLLEGEENIHNNITGVGFDYAHAEKKGGGRGS
jgi:hypothetical protein